ncbi:hypothetical protein M9H77_31411 [Catharanthus roseus]|uniref:Uncharacterized protein n=1 Tax=Catharanthus roseus TaxID=4058 RepID=A0ACC0A225_CATRO|nr:hypothetical protein M9H77_31411 [Catharanthus roseus]
MKEHSAISTSGSGYFGPSTVQQRRLPAEACSSLFPSSSRRKGPQGQHIPSLSHPKTLATALNTGVLIAASGGGLLHPLKFVVVVGNDHFLKAMYSPALVTFVNALAGVSVIWGSLRLVLKKPC